jgi:hypothetical protein
MNVNGFELLREQDEKEWTRLCKNPAGSRRWPGFMGSYDEYIVNAAVSTNDAALLERCIDHGYVCSTDRTLDNSTVRKRCRQVNASQCEALLAELGWPE